MEPEGSLPHSQEPATCPYPEPYHIYMHVWSYHMCNSLCIYYNETFQAQVTGKIKYILRKTHFLRRSYGFQNNHVKTVNVCFLTRTFYLQSVMVFRIQTKVSKVLYSR
jgi:hypothetical protein